MFPSSQFLCNLLLIVLIRVSSSMLYRTNERGPLYLVPDFSGTTPSTRAWRLDFPGAAREAP